MHCTRSCEGAGAIETRTYQSEHVSMEFITASFLIQMTEGTTYGSEREPASVCQNQPGDSCLTQTWIKSVSQTHSRQSVTRVPQGREERTSPTASSWSLAHRLLHHGIRQAAVSPLRIPPDSGGEGNTAEYRIDGKWKRSNLQSRADEEETNVLMHHHKAGLWRMHRSSHNTVHKPASWQPGTSGRRVRDSHWLLAVALVDMEDHHSSTSISSVITGSYLSHTLHTCSSYTLHQPAWGQAFSSVNSDERWTTGPIWNICKETLPNTPQGRIWTRGKDIMTLSKLQEHYS